MESHAGRNNQHLIYQERQRPAPSAGACGFSDHSTNRSSCNRPYRSISRSTRLPAAAAARPTWARPSRTGSDKAALIRRIDQPGSLLGDSYGGQCALAAALSVPRWRVRALIRYRFDPARWRTPERSRSPPDGLGQPARHLRHRRLGGGSAQRPHGNPAGASARGHPRLQKCTPRR